MKNCTKEMAFLSTLTNLIFSSDTIILLQVRQALTVCYRIVLSATRTTLSHVAQGTIVLRLSPIIVPAIQFLTTPLYAWYDDDLSVAQPTTNRLPVRPSRHSYSSTVSFQSSPRSSFFEDYDDWYSHGKVDPRTRTTLDEPFVAGFLLNEIACQRLQLDGNLFHAGEDVDGLPFEFITPAKDLDED
jgi:hypothetical protein